MSWLAVLDMDGTLLEQRSVDVLCEKLGLMKELESIDQLSTEIEGYKVSSKIAQLFSGFQASTLETIVDTIPFVQGALKFIAFLKSRGFISSIVTDSYTLLASRVAHRLDIDAVRGNKLEIVDNVITGKIKSPLGWEKFDVPNCQRKAVCKLHAMTELANLYAISDDHTLAIGDSRSDTCMVREARIGVAFRPKDDFIVEAADVVIHTDFLDLQRWLEHFLDRFTKIN